MKTTILTAMLFGAMLSAQTVPPAQTTPAPAVKTGKVATRQARQQARVAQGVKTGELTAHETAKIENKEAKINKEIRADRKANGGNLTNNEKKHINKQQNSVSKTIHDDKHITAVQPR